MGPEEHFRTMLADTTVPIKLPIIVDGCVPEELNVLWSQVGERPNRTLCLYANGNFQG